MLAENILLLTLLIPLFGSFLVLASGFIWKKAPGILACVIAAVTLGLELSILPFVTKHSFLTVSIPWISIFKAGFFLRADSLSILAALTMSIITTLALIYSLGYYQKQGQSSVFYALVTAFLGGMIGTVIASETILFYLFWELMLVPSYLLLNFWGEGKFKTRSGFMYFVFTHIGAVAMLSAILWIFSQTGITDIYAIAPAIAHLPLNTLLTLAGLFFFGFAVKMAIFPFHSWLPETYDDAPVPITIIISGAMMSAGIYGMIRFPLTLFPHNIILKFQVPLMIFAIITQLYGGVMALTTHRIRRILAYSSISQMGYVLFGIATLTGFGVGGSIFHLLNHGLIKSLLFMIAGSVILQTARQKTTELGGLAKNMPVSTWGCVIGSLALAGAPPLNGFYSEMMILSGGFGTPHWVLTLFSLAGGVVTATYALRIVRRIFYGPVREELSTIKESNRLMQTPILILTALIIGIGIIPGSVITWVKTALKIVGINLI